MKRVQQVSPLAFAPVKRAVRHSYWFFLPLDWAQCVEGAYEPMFSVKAVSMVNGCIFSAMLTSKPHGCCTTWWPLLCHPGREFCPLPTLLWLCSFNSHDLSTEVPLRTAFLSCTNSMYMVTSTYTYSDTSTFSCAVGFVNHFQYFACQGVHGLEAWGKWEICLMQGR